MSELTKTVGQRIRSYRTRLGLSQEKLAELSGFHPTYIGQLERGEKNATIESIERITAPLNISLSELFKNLDSTDTGKSNIALECYEFLLTKTIAEQQQILKILYEIYKYRNN